MANHFLKVRAFLQTTMKMFHVEDFRMTTSRNRLAFIWFLTTAPEYGLHGNETG